MNYTVNRTNLISLLKPKALVMYALAQEDAEFAALINTFNTTKLRDVTVVLRVAWRVEGGYTMSYGDKSSRGLDFSAKQMKRCAACYRTLHPDELTRLQCEVRHARFTLGTLCHRDIEECYAYANLCLLFWANHFTRAALEDRAN